MAWPHGRVQGLMWVHFAARIGPRPPPRARPWGGHPMTRPGDSIARPGHAIRRQGHTKTGPSHAILRSICPHNIWADLGAIIPLNAHDLHPRGGVNYPSLGTSLLCATPFSCSWCQFIPRFSGECQILILVKNGQERAHTLCSAQPELASLNGT